MASGTTTVSARIFLKANASANLIIVIPNQQQGTSSLILDGKVLVDGWDHRAQGDLDIQIPSVDAIDKRLICNTIVTDIADATNDLIVGYQMSGGRPLWSKYFEETVEEGDSHVFVAVFSFKTDPRG